MNLLFDIAALKKAGHEQGWLIVKELNNQPVINANISHAFADSIKHLWDLLEYAYPHDIGKSHEEDLTDLPAQTREQYERYFEVLFSAQIVCMHAFLNGMDIENRILHDFLFNEEGQMDVTSLRHSQTPQSYLRALSNTNNVGKNVQSPFAKPSAQIDLYRNVSFGLLPQWLEGVFNSEKAQSSEAQTFRRALQMEFKIAAIEVAVEIEPEPPSDHRQNANHLIGVIRAEM